MRNLDIVILAYNEEENIKPLADNLVKELEAIGERDFKVIFVENGSDDNSYKLLQELNNLDDRIVGVSLSRNFGPQGALHAGLSTANAKYVCVMDGDQQDPPLDAAKMYLEIKKTQSDVIYAVRKSRKEKFFRKLGFLAFYRVWNFFSEVDIPLDAGEFSVMRMRVVNAILSSNEIHRFNRGLRTWAGFKQIPYYHDRPDRVAGEQKFNIVKDLILGFQAIVSFSILPLRLIFFLGVTLALISFVLMMINLAAISLNYFGVSWLFNLLPQGIITLNLIDLFFQGVLFISLGIIGEYVGKIYEQSKGRSTFIIRDYIGKINE